MNGSDAAVVWRSFGLGRTAQGEAGRRCVASGHTEREPLSPEHGRAKRTGLKSADGAVLANPPIKALANDRSGAPSSFRIDASAINVLRQRFPQVQPEGPWIRVFVDGADADEAIARTREALSELPLLLHPNATAELGVKYLSSHLGFIDHNQPEQYQKLLGRTKALADYAAGKGVA